MSSSWHQKKAKEAEYQEEVKLKRMGNLDESQLKVWDPTETGEDELFEKKLSKEEKKALAKKKREEKKRAKEAAKKGGKDGSRMVVTMTTMVKTTRKRLMPPNSSNQPARRPSTAITSILASTTLPPRPWPNREQSVPSPRPRRASMPDPVISTLPTSRLQHKGMVMLDGTEIILNHGQRYGLIGRNGCGKSTLMNALGARAVPIPDGIDVFHLKEEIEPSDTITALEAVMSVDVERENLEKEVENLNDALAQLAEQDDAMVVAVVIMMTMTTRD